jgi:hypothetical protein
MKNVRVLIPKPIAKEQEDTQQSTNVRSVVMTRGSISGSVIQQKRSMESR